MEHPHHLPTFDIAQGNHAQPEQLSPIMPNSGKRKGKRLRDWDEEETSALLDCVNSPQFRDQKRNQYYMKWDAIAEEIQNRLVRADSAISGKRCKERMKTLRGYHQQVRAKKKKAGVTEAEWRKSNGIAVNWWYKAIGDFRGPREGKSISKLNARKSTNKQIAEKLNSLNDWRRSTLLDLNFCADFLEESAGLSDDWELPSISNLCGWLSIVQNRSCLAIYEDVIALEKMGLVSTWQSVDELGEGSDDDGEVISKLHLKSSSLRVYKKIFKKVMDRNPAYDTRRRIQDEAMVTFDATCAPPGITVLCLHECEELEVVDLSGFRKLRFLSIGECPKLRELIGCECLEELGWLEIYYCPSYHGYPPLQKFPSLQEFRFLTTDCLNTSSRGRPGGELDVSGCVRLRTLEIVGDGALSSIRGLEGLRSLTVLKLLDYRAPEILPDIGHMKDLTHLSITSTSVEEIKGVEKLSSLNELECFTSKLKTLPDLSHLPHLQSVSLRSCPVVDDPSSIYYKQWYREFNPENKHVDVSDVSDTEHDLSDEAT